MKKAFLIMFLISQVGLMQAQGMKYEYVRVPEKFEFLKEENKYQVNALTAFLFEKYGFNVLYKEAVPAGVNPCEVLKADVENNSNLFRTKVQVTLKDCADKIVFTSEEGVSREKDYKTSYHEALRNAFESIEGFTSEGFVSSEAAEQASGNEVTSNNSVNSTSGTDEVSDATTTVSVTSEELTSNRTFRNGGQSYILKKDASGYALFREGEDEKFGSLIKSGGGSNYIYTSKNLQGNAFFEPSGDLVVEYLDANSGQLVSVKYELQD